VSPDQPSTAQPRITPAAWSNFGWLAVDKLVRMALGVLVGFWVARHLGPADFGALNYAFAAVTLFLPVAGMGLDALVRRILLVEPARADDCLYWARRVRGAAACACYALILAWVLLAPMDARDRQLLLIAGLTLFQPAGMVADLWLQAHLHARASVLAQWVALAVGAAWRVILILGDASLMMFAWVAVAEMALVAAGVELAARRLGRPREARAPGRSLLGELVRGALPLLLSGLAIALYLRIDVVMLRWLAGVEAAGIYAAAVRISELWYFVPMALASSLLPAVLHSRAEGPEAYARRLQQFYDLNAAVALVAATVTALVATPIVAWTYGPAYAAAAPVLRWHAWAAVFVFIGVVRGQFLVNENLGWFYFVATGTGAVLNIALNFWLIPRAGPVGAAQATLVSYAVASWLSSWFSAAMRPTAVMQSLALLIPFRAWGYFRRS
jgi:O-antigen/teichoic acid export membrane protein